MQPAAALTQPFHNRLLIGSTPEEMMRKTFPSELSSGPGPSFYGQPEPSFTGSHLVRVAGGRTEFSGLPPPSAHPALGGWGCFPTDCFQVSHFPVTRDRLKPLEETRDREGVLLTPDVWAAFPVQKGACG